MNTILSKLVHDNNRCDPLQVSFGVLGTPVERLLTWHMYMYSNNERVEDHVSLVSTVLWELTHDEFAPKTMSISASGLAAISEQMSKLLWSYPNTWSILPFVVKMRSMPDGILQEHIRVLTDYVSGAPARNLRTKQCYLAVSRAFMYFQQHVLAEFSFHKPSRASSILKGLSLLNR